jgi:hypothetical protein
MSSSLSIKEHFTTPARYKQWSLGLMTVGVISLIIGFIIYRGGNDASGARFWATLLHNSVYFLLIVNSAVFFFAAHTLGMAGWVIGFRRLTEALGACVTPLGIICFVILMCLVFGGHSTLYSWTDKSYVAHDEVMQGKSGFLSPGFFTIYTVLTIGLWMLLGKKMRDLSRMIDNRKLTAEEGKRYIFTNTVIAACYIVWFALTVASVVPWLWLMSLEAKWFSTMFSWYTFASAWVSGIALMTIFIIYLKNQGYLEYVNQEHLHDMAKYQFAFSIFWCYLWFDQFMLIWYANISEETIYFKTRFDGVYAGIFYLNFIINFVAPLLIFMKRGSKRNWGTVTFMSVLLVFGHWLDFYQMVFPSVSKDHVPLNLFDFGVALGFVGLIMWQTARVLGKYPLLARNHPYVKESIIHHT